MKISDIPYRKRLALNLHKKYVTNEKSIHQLNYILWECTLRCNLNCKHCGSDCKQDSAIKDMPREDFFRALDELTPIIKPNKTMIVLTGGEALLRDDIDVIGQELSDRGFPWGVVSNGMNMNKDMLTKLLKAGMRTATISLDGLETSHNWLRGNDDSFRKAVEAIALLSHTKNVRYDVATCVNQRNFTELDALYQLLLKLNLKEWRIFSIYPIGRAVHQELLQLPAKKFKALFEFIKRVRKEGKMKVNYGCEGFLGTYEGEVRDNFFFCRAGINVASILADGSISACPNLRDNFIQGNIYNDNFKDVWENKYQIFRDRSWTEQGICADCDFYSYCEGNGMHLWNPKNGKLLFCHLKRIQEADFIEMLEKKNTISPKRLKLLTK